MSDPKAPDDPVGDDAIDRAYAQAEHVLRDDEAERAARRARVLAAVAAADAEPQAQAEPAPAVTPLPPPRKPMARPAPWLMAAGVAGVAALVGLRIAPTAVERPARVESAPAPPAAAPAAATPLPVSPAPVAPASPAPAPAAETADAARDAAPPPAAAAPGPAPVVAEAAPAPSPARAKAAPPAAAPPIAAPMAPPPAAPVERRAESYAAPPPPPPPPPPAPAPQAERRVFAPAPAAALSSRATGAARRFVITSPDWARRPSVKEIAEYYPERAVKTETNGNVTLSCTVTAEGALVNCEVISETPEAYGFADAALRLSRIYRMNPKRADGGPIEGGTVRVPILFRVPN